MKLHVWPTPEAELHILKLGAWWRAHREKAPNLFREQLNAAIAYLAENPLTGEHYRRRGVRDLRRYRLKKTPYHVYYVPRIDQADLVIVAVWSSMRKEGPPIHMP